MCLIYGWGRAAPGVSQISDGEFSREESEEGSSSWWEARQKSAVVIMRWGVDIMRPKPHTPPGCLSRPQGPTFHPVCKLLSHQGPFISAALSFPVDSQTLEMLGSVPSLNLSSVIRAQIHHVSYELHWSPKGSPDRWHSMIVTLTEQGSADKTATWGQRCGHILSHACVFLGRDREEIEGWREWMATSVEVKQSAVARILCQNLNAWHMDDNFDFDLTYELEKQPMLSFPVWYLLWQPEKHREPLTTCF